MFDYVRGPLYYICLLAEERLSFTYLDTGLGQTNIKAIYHHLQDEDSDSDILPPQEIAVEWKKNFTQQNAHHYRPIFLII